jgi:hypothetical protein
MTAKPTSTGSSSILYLAGSREVETVQAAAKTRILFQLWMRAKTGLIEIVLFCKKVLIALRLSSEHSIFERLKRGELCPPVVIWR